MTPAGPRCSSAPRTTLVKPKCFLEHVKIRSILYGLYSSWQLVLPQDQESAPRATLATPKCFLGHLKIDSVWPAQQLVLSEDQECAPRATLANAKRTPDHVRNCIPA